MRWMLVGSDGSMSIPAKGSAPNGSAMETRGCAAASWKRIRAGSSTERASGPAVDGVIVPVQVATRTRLAVDDLRSTDGVHARDRR